MDWSEKFKEIEVTSEMEDGTLSDEALCFLYSVYDKDISKSTNIEYDGLIVATVEGGNTATLPIADKKMKSDIVVTVPEAESGTNSAIPTKVSTEAEMNALLSSGIVGGVYKYTGESTDAYENGALYVLEEEAEEAESIVGTWVLNDSTVAWGYSDPGPYITVSFAVNGKNYKAMYYDEELDYVDSNNARTHSSSGDTITITSSVAYKGLDGTTEDITEMFLTWLKANATKTA